MQKLVCSQYIAVDEKKIFFHEILVSFQYNSISLLAHF